MQALSLIDLPPGLDLQKHTTGQLIDLVKRILTGPRTWTRASVAPPTVVHEAVLHPDFSPLFMHAVRVKLLDGARLVMIAKPMLFEIWDISTARRIWTWRDHPILMHEHVLNLGVELDTNGNDMTLAIIYREPDRRGWNTVEIMRIDLRADQPESVVCIPIERYNAFWDPRVCGDFVALPLASPHGGILLINWREQTSVLIGLPGSLSAPSLGLIPGYLLVTARDGNAPHPEQIMIYSLMLLAALLKPTADQSFTDHVPIARLTPVVVETLALNSLQFSDVTFSHMAVHASPLRRETYQISVYVWGYYRGRGEAAFIRYLCTTGDELDFKFISCLPASPHTYYHSFTYAGHPRDGLKFDIHNSLHVPGPDKSVRPVPVLLADSQCVARDVSGYGYAVATLTAESLRISFYE